MRLKKMTTNQKVLITASGIYLLGIIVFALLLFVPTGIHLLLGWLLGMVISFICFGLLVAQSYFLTGQNVSGGALVAVFFSLRFFLYGLGLFVSAYLFYKLEIRLFNLFTVFGAYLPIRLGIYLFTFLERREHVVKVEAGRE
ncbi:MAG: hypothetical protein ACOX3K_01595 [Bacilli bacterium]